MNLGRLTLVNLLPFLLSLLTFGLPSFNQPCRLTVTSCHEHVDIMYNAHVRLDAGTRSGYH